jgi:hypothetical protein
VPRQLFAMATFGKRLEGPQLAPGRRATYGLVARRDEARERAVS